MKKNIAVLCMAVFLAACTSQPSRTLDQKLVDSTPQERKEILRIECLNEAEWPIYHSPQYRRADSRLKHIIRMRYNPEVSRMKSLCREMTELEVSNSKEKVQELSSMCRDVVTNKIRKNTEGGKEHALRIKKVCEEMIEQSIKI